MSDAMTKPKDNLAKDNKKVEEKKKKKAPEEKPPLPKITPKVDMRENETQFFISIELPGLKKKNVKVMCNTTSVSIVAKKKGPKTLKKETNQQVELEYGIFERTIKLPKTVNPKKAAAKLRNGLFTLELPKKDYSKMVKIKVK